MRAALSHSRSSVAGQKASRWTRLPELAAATLILGTFFDPIVSLGGAAAVLVPQPQKLLAMPPVLLTRLATAGGGPLVGLVEAEALLSHDGRKAETRCMASRPPLRRGRNQVKARQRGLNR